MNRANGIFFIVAIAANIAVPYWFMRDIRARYPSLWTAIGSPSPMGESAGSLVSKTLKGLRRLSSDPGITHDQRLYCLRSLWLLAATYVLGIAAILIVVAQRKF